MSSLLKLLLIYFAWLCTIYLKSLKSFKIVSIFKMFSITFSDIISVDNRNDKRTS